MCTRRRMLLEGSDHRNRTICKLSASEKRRRMIEAGKKYTAMNVTPRHTIKTDATLGSIERKSAVSHHFGLQVPSIKPDEENRQSVHFNRIHDYGHPKGSEVTPVQKNKIGNVSFGSISVKRFVNSERKASEDEFQNDEKSLKEIVDGISIGDSTSKPLRLTHLRERHSLFPNGINPLDIPPSRMRPSMSVRITESKKSVGRMILNICDMELDNQLRSLPTESLNKLEAAVHRQILMRQRDGESVQEQKISASHPGMGIRSHASLSQVFADQEVTLLTEKRTSSEEDDNDDRPLNPLASLFRTPDNYQ